MSPKAFLQKVKEEPHVLGHLLGKTKLTRQQGKWIKDCWDNLEYHKGLMAHRGAYKTTAITEVGCLRWLLFHPNDRIAIIRKPYTEASKTLTTIRNFFLLDDIKALFYFAHGVYPKLSRNRENSLIFNFKKSITKEGNLDAYSIDGQLTGNHYDKFICDDIVVSRDRVSKAERETTKNAVRELVTNIIDPGKYGIFIGTPWHRADAWKIIAEADIPIDKYTIYDTGILSEEEIEIKKRTTTGSLFSCNYELVHVAQEGALFANPVYGVWNKKLMPVVAHLDAKFKGDHTNGLTIASPKGNNRYQFAGFCYSDHVQNCADDIITKIKKYKVSKFYIETNPDQGYTSAMLKEKIKNANVKCIVKEYFESMNKHHKIVTHLKDYWERIDWDEDTDPEYLEQVIDYKEGQVPDDCPDSAASLIRQVYHKQKDMLALYQF